MANRIRKNLGKIYGYAVLGLVVVAICVVLSITTKVWWMGLAFAGGSAVISSAAYFSQR